MDQKARTNEEVDPYIKKLPEEIQRIVLALREIILESSPKRIEEYKWSMPNYSYNGVVCYIQPAKISAFTKEMNSRKWRQTIYRKETVKQCGIFK